MPTLAPTSPGKTSYYRSEPPPPPAGMGGATRFMTLLTTPFPPLRPSRILLHRRIFSLSINPRRLLTLSSPSKIKTQIPQLVNCLHSQPSNSTYALHSSAAQQQQNHPWPEWTNFLNSLSNGQGFFALRITEFQPRTRSSCMRNWPMILYVPPRLLSRRDIEAVVSNGTPFLFKSALDTARRMKVFWELMEAIDGQTQKPFGQHIEMKRGDWICQKCNFFNYGRNMVCLRCDCRRPGAPLFNNNNSQSGSGYNGNYSFNINTDKGSAENEERAQRWFSKISQLNTANDSNNEPLEGRLANSQHQNNLTNNGERATQIDIQSKEKEQADYSEVKNENFQFLKDAASQIDIRDKENEQAEKSERWFKKMAELHDVKDLPSAVSDEDFPEIMPMRKGENRFVVSKKKDRSLTSPKYKRQVAMDQANNTNFVLFVPFRLATSIERIQSNPTVKSHL
ncbi:hypothetical protein DH2020_014062 [Rehmannia glutinosa]|uniref:RanBP2-type domain-containing protein n=1 Tax=Rehmannia glutinosa TaxID=99300 RepID=A0ABR0WVA9_REHGL